MSGMGTVDGAYFETETDLVFPASIGAVRGTYVKPNLQFQLGLGEVRAEIGAADAVVERPMASPLNFGFNAVCTDRQVAMGVMTLVAING